MINNSRLSEKEMYMTSDLCIAASPYLHYPLKKISRKGSKAVFTFQKDRNFDLIMERFWRGDLMAEVKQYYNSLKILKSAIYNS